MHFCIYYRRVIAELIEEVRLETQVTRQFAPSAFGARPVARPQRHPRAEAWADEFDSGLSIGQRVDHSLFGEGTILAFEGAGANVKVQVRFDDGQARWLVMAYAKLVPLG